MTKKGVDILNSQYGAWLDTVEAGMQNGVISRVIEVDPNGRATIAVTVHGASDSTTRLSGTMAKDLATTKKK